METITQILDLLVKALDYAPFIATVGAFSIIGQLAKEIFTKAKAVRKSKYQWFFWRMRQSLPLHPIAAGIILGLVDPTHGVGYYALAGLLSVFAFDLIERYTGFDIKLPSESLPPEGPTEDSK